MKKKVISIGIICILIFIVTIAGIAYAKYVSIFHGQTEMKIAKWSFKVIDGEPQTIDVLDFPITRTDNNSDVQEGNIAPGTYGEFQIEIDPRGTETMITYEINIEFTNKPKNLKFYLDENMTYELGVINNNLKISDLLSLEDVKNTVNKEIYWKWAMETGNTEEEIYNNDLIDSEFIGKNVEMLISVTGKQVLGGENNQDYVVLYDGNGATSGSVYADVVVSATDKIVKNNEYEKKYVVNLDANGGNVDEKSVISECEFSHWSLDGRNSDVAFYSEKEVNNQNSYWGLKGTEFIQYADIAPFVDFYGVGNYYLCCDLKSENVSKYNVISVYCQNGSSARYNLYKLGSTGWAIPLYVREEYKNFKINVEIIRTMQSDKNAMLAFYGTYGTGNFPVVKNVKLDVGKGYEELETINYDEIKTELNNNTLKLYAKWIPKSVNLPIPSKEGHTFLGWYTEKNGGTKVDDVYTPAGNVTLYAHWN